MDFEIGLIFIIGYSLSLSKSQTRFHVYYSAPGQQYQRFYTLSGDQWIEFFKAGQTSNYPPYSFSNKNILWYPKYSTFHHFPKYRGEGLNTGYVLIYQNNYSTHYESLKKAHAPYTKNFDDNFDYRIHDNEIKYSKSKNFNKYSSTLYFEEYPHLKSLLKHQKTRTDNKLPPLKLKSLRIDSPYFRI